MGIYTFAGTPVQAQSWFTLAVLLQLLMGPFPILRCPGFSTVGTVFPLLTQKNPVYFSGAISFQRKQHGNVRPRHHTCLLPWPWAPKWGKTCSAQPTGERTSANSMVHRSDCRPPGFWPRQPGGEVWKEEAQL